MALNSCSPHAVVPPRSPALPFGPCLGGVPCPLFQRPSCLLSADVWALPRPLFRFGCDVVSDHALASLRRPRIDTGRPTPSISLSFFSLVDPTRLGSPPQTARLVTHNQVRGIFGFTDSHNIGCQAFPAVQAAPSFSSAFPVPLGGSSDRPCLIPCAIDQVLLFAVSRTCMCRILLCFSRPARLNSPFEPRGVS